MCVRVQCERKYRRTEDSEEKIQSRERERKRNLAREEGYSKQISERKWTLGATPASVGRIRRGAQKEVGAIVLYCRLRLLRPSVDDTGGGNHTHGGAMPQ